MKTFIKTMILYVLIASGGTGIVSAKNLHKAIGKKYLDIRSISVEGNVDIILKQATAFQITYSEDNSGNVRIVEQSGKLSITTTGSGRAKLIVSVRDLYRIKVSGNSTIKTDGQIRTKYLQLFLSENAEANIDSQTEGLYTVLQGKANLTLTGLTNKHDLFCSTTPVLTFEKFAAKTTKSQTMDEYKLLYALKP